MKTGGWCMPDPCDFDPWCKAYLGWTSPISITSNDVNINAEIAERGTSPETDAIKIIYGGDELFLIEKRPGELGPSVWRVRCSKENEPIVRLIARDSPIWAHSLQSAEKQLCINFEVQGSSHLGQTLLLRFNNPKISCQIIANIQDQHAVNSLSIETAPIINATDIFSSKRSLFLIELDHKNEQHEYKNAPRSIPLIPISKEKKSEHKKLAIRAINNIREESSGSCETSTNNNCGCGCNNGNNCNSCCCCCCCCCGCKSCDKCSKYDNKADYYWKCDDEKCIPYNDEDDAPVPEECYDGSSSQSRSESSSSKRSSSLSSSSSSSSSSPSSKYSTSIFSTETQDNSENDVSSDESDSDYSSTSSSHNYGSAEEEENVMICSSFTYELPQGRKCPSSEGKSSLFEESSHVRQPSSRASSSGSSGSSSGGGGGNGMRKNSAGQFYKKGFSVMSLLFLT